jgi:hypothetical protein
MLLNLFQKLKKPFPGHPGGGHVCTYVGDRDEPGTGFYDHGPIDTFLGHDYMIPFSSFD